MTARIQSAHTPEHVDAVVRGRLSRRAFVALAAAGSLSLAGCATSGTTEDAQDAVSDVADGVQPASDASDAAEEPVSLSTFVFNSLCTVTAYGVAEDTVTDCLKACYRYEGLFSARTEGTDIYRLNEAGGEQVEVDPDTAELLELSRQFAASSEGTFDPTVGAVSLLWDFAEAVKPSDGEIAEALTHVGWEGLHVEGTKAWLDDPLAKVDLGGIAKGWIARQLADMLVEAGSTSAMVNLGTSSVVAIGTKPDGSAWRVGLRDPLDSMSSLTAVVEIADECITSSGLYDQQFEVDGTWYWHILDPATGYPAQTDVMGNTIIGSDPTEGDATSTMLFVMGSERGAAWLEEEHPDLAAIFMLQDGENVFANGFEDHGYAPLEG